MMTSNRPYLLRALHEWVIDNAMTPYILVNAEYEDTIVPIQFIENGRIIFDISPHAIRNLDMSNERVSFNARFGGQSMEVWIPINAVLAIYAKENGQGMLFAEDMELPEEEENISKPERKKTNLKIVK